MWWRLYAGVDGNVIGNCDEEEVDEPRTSTNPTTTFQYAAMKENQDDIGVLILMRRTTSL